MDESDDNEENCYSLAEIQDLITNKSKDLNEFICGGLTPLMLEVEYGHIETIEMLLNVKDIRVNLRDDMGNSALYYCFNPNEDVSRETQLHCFKLLLNSGQINWYSFHENTQLTPLMMAAQLCDEDFLTEIIKVAYSEKGNSICSGDRNDEVDIQEDDMNEDENIDDNECDSADNMDENDNEEGYDNEDNYDYNEVMNCDNEDVQLPLLNVILDEDEFDYHMITANNFIDSDYDNRVMVGEHMLMFEEDEAIMRYLRKLKISKKSIDLYDFKSKKTAFQHCITAFDEPVERQINCLKLLIDAGANKMVLFKEKLTPIQLALDKYNDVHPSIIQYLISIGCQLDVQQNFIQASCYLHIPIIQLLIEHGANPHWKNAANQNVLHYFFLWDNIDYFENEEIYEKLKNTLRYLVCELKIDINAIDDQGSCLFSLTFLNLIKGIKFPFLFFVSENADFSALYNSKSLDLHKKRFQKARIFSLMCSRVDEYELLYNIGLPYQLICYLHDRERNEPNQKTLKWLEQIQSAPRSLFSICKFAVRKMLGSDIKSKVDQIKMPECIKHLVLLKDILPEECFE